MMPLEVNIGGKLEAVELEDRLTGPSEPPNRGKSNWKLLLMSQLLLETGWLTP